jgi:hypothetical protein
VAATNILTPGRLSVCLLEEKWMGGKKEKQAGDSFLVGIGASAGGFQAEAQR